MRQCLCAMMSTALPGVCITLSRASWIAASLSASSALVASARDMKLSQLPLEIVSSYVVAVYEHSSEFTVEY